MSRSEKYTDADIRRKAASILRKLKNNGVVLLSVPGAEGMYGVYNRASAGQAPKAKLSRDLVHALLSKDWIEKVRDGYCISSSGLAWLKRSKSEEEIFRSQHQTIVSKDIKSDTGSSRTVRVNDEESPLDWFRKRKDKNGKYLISEAQYEAGERLRRDFTLGHLGQRVTANWSALAKSRKRKHGGATYSSTDIADSAMEARERVHKALEYVGPEMSGMLLDICCFLKGLEETEKAQNLPQRSGKVVLQIALSRLARFYGYGSDTTNYAAKNLQWGSDDFRPSI